MASLVLNEIEHKANRLSLKEQLLLIERLVHRLRAKNAKDKATEQNPFKKQLPAMAKDKEIQTELQKINQEFSIAETE